MKGKYIMKNILVFGDSNVWGWLPSKPDVSPGPAQRPDFENRLAGMLQKGLGDEYRVIEDGLPGRTAMLDDPLSPNHRGYPHLEVALELHAPVDVLVMQLGTNELRHMFGMSADMIACSVERLVNLAKHPASGYPAKRIILVAPHPMHPRSYEMCFGFMFGSDAYKKSLGFSAAYKALADRQGVEFFDCAPLKFELNEVDGVHYSVNDNRRLAEALIPIIKG